MSLYIGDRVVVDNPNGPYHGRRGVVVQFWISAPPVVSILLDGWLPSNSIRIAEALLKLDVLDTLAQI